MTRGLPDGADVRVGVQPGVGGDQRAAEMARGGGEDARGHGPGCRGREGGGLQGDGIVHRDEAQLRQRADACQGGREARQVERVRGYGCVASSLSSISVARR